MVAAAIVHFGMFMLSAMLRLDIHSTLTMLVVAGALPALAVAIVWVAQTGLPEHFRPAGKETELMRLAERLRRQPAR